MRSVLGSIGITIAAGCLACGARTPNATAGPRAPASPAASELLIAAELKDDAEIARAIREYYTKYEYRIRMRDGVELHTAVYVPKNRSHTYPMLMRRSPYGSHPYGVDNYPAADNARVLHQFGSTPMVRDGFIFVQQDVRGRFMSGGTFVDIRPIAKTKSDIDESTDTWDTVDWLVKNAPANNGNVGVLGISYPGFYAAQAAVNAHPAVKAVSPQAPVTEWFLGDDFHHNGALCLADAFDFFSSFGKPRPKPVKTAKWDSLHETGDVYDFFLSMGPLANANTNYLHDEIGFWNDLIHHGTRDDFWKARDPRPHYKGAKPAVMTVGGWFDREDLYGALETYRAFEKQSPGAKNSLVMGPWIHGGWARNDGDRLGDVSFGSKTSAFYRDRIELPFFQQHLKGRPVPPTPEAWVFETGTNTWQSYASWPPEGAKPAFFAFHAQGKLSSAPVGKAEDEAGLDAYVSDPQKPVPYRSKPSSSMEADYMIDDQRFASRRPDVMTYATGELTADLTLAGPLEATLWVSTTGTDADFVVKLVDVYPTDYADPVPNPSGVRMGGYQQLVRGEVMRGKFRTSYEKPEPFKPGEPTLIRFTLPDVHHTFRPGHRLMVQVQSTWFPLIDRNPQTFTDIYKATAADFRVQTHRVHRTAQMMSGLKVTVAKGTSANLP